MKIGLIDEDNTGYPNLALMKLSAWHKKRGHVVEWYTPFENYDIVYTSKVFTFRKGYQYPIENAGIVIKGGTGNSFSQQLPKKIDLMQPDYTIYPGIGERDAYGFLTRGCTNLCSWCIVPDKEGFIRPYMDIIDITLGGLRNRVTLMDNNILSSGDYAVDQLKKIIDNNIRVDFNQAMDARFVDEDMADLLSKVKWIRNIRFGCDTIDQQYSVDHAIEKIIKKGYKGEFLLYTMLHGDIKECYERLYFWKNQSMFANRVILHAQPYRDRYGSNNIPQWQKDMARWANRRWIYKSVDFNDYEPRKGIKGKQIIEQSM